MNRAAGAAYSDVDARGDLDWLKRVGALRRIEEDDDGGFVVELPSRKLLALPTVSVPAFRAGVLAGWRLPRTERAPG